MVWKTKRKKKNAITSFLNRSFPYWAEEDNNDDENSIFPQFRRYKRMNYWTM